MNARRNPKTPDDRADAAFLAFRDHYLLARKTTGPEAALHTAYVAAQNYLTSLKPSDKEGGG